jgi:hypothetical protein
MHNILHWIARVWSVLSIAMLVLFVFGEAFETRPSGTELVGLIFFPIGVMVGLILAWWREMAGGLVAVGSLAAFYLWNFFQGGRLPLGPWFVLVVMPGFLFLISALSTRRA